MERSAQNPERIAVVFVHGQGDQRPMKDVLELANSCWETDPRAAGVQQLAPIWSVPTEEAESLPDQRRLVSGAESGVQVDFYQFYWAHLMHGSRFIHVWVWLMDLFSKDPNSVPSGLRQVRDTAMRASLAPILLAVIFCVVSIYHLLVLNYLLAVVERRTRLSEFGITPGAFEVPLVSWELFFCALFLIALVAFFLPIGGFRKSRRKWALYWAVIVLGGGLLFWTGAHWHPHYWVNVAEYYCGTFDHACVEIIRGETGGLQVGADGGAATQQNLKRPTTEVAWMSGLALVDAWAWASERGFVLTSYNLLTTIFTVTLVAFGTTAFALYFLNRSFLAPVMADSARYFRAAPENIKARHKIRRAGVKLLERLHKSKRGYDRIVVVGHSLGSVVAYGMVEHVWGKHMRHVDCAAPHLEPMLRQAEDAGRAIVSDPHDVFAHAAFRHAQRALFEQLRSPRTVPAPDNEIGAWRISDFITLGSPMTYGPFLLADSASEFEAQARKHRRFSLCPPDGAWEDGALRFSFKDTDGALNMHHSALFGAVRWTNIHFATKGLIRGDIIGGPVGHIFGSGVVDIECDPAETLKTFAHNEYWRWPGDKDGAQWLGGQGRAFRQCPRYLLALRRALNLFDDPTEEQLLLKMSRGEV